MSEAAICAACIGGILFVFGLASAILSKRKIIRAASEEAGRKE